MSALAGLPEAVFTIAPELRLLEGVDEPRSTCTACPIAVPGDQLASQPHMMHKDARCCTYHPTIPTWLLGRALREPDSGALVRARLQDPVGVSAQSIGPPSDLVVQKQDFGRNLADRCPYWVGGELACGIWKHRTEVCRGWFCRFSDGERSVKVWRAARFLMLDVFDKLGEYCLSHGEPPPDNAPAEEMAAWYLQCAQLVDDASDDALLALRDGAIEKRAEMLKASLGSLHGPLPDLLTPALAIMAPRPEGGFTFGHATYWDTVDVPGNIFLFIGRLDGQTPWRQALTQAQADGLVFSEADVEHLYRLGILRHNPSSMEPGMYVFVNDEEKTAPD